ncbi:MAG: HEAT repeat domain-containing protein, partial [Planctomycetota bacterium]
PAKVADDASESDRLNSILKAPQPNTSWSRSRWLPLCRPLGAEAFRNAALDETRRVAERMRAVEILVEVFGGLDSPTATSLADAGSPLIRARAAWAVGRSNPETPDTDVLRRFLADRSPIVRRFALESLTSVSKPAVWSKVLNEIAQSLAEDDRLVRFTAAQLLGRLSDIQRDAIRKALVEHKQGLLWFSLGSLLRKTTLNASAAEVAMNLIADTSQPIELRRDAIRILQMSLSDVGPDKDRPVMFDGYASRASMDSIERDLNPILASLTDVFPSGDAMMDHELIRVIAMTTPPNRELFSKLLAGITESSLPADDIHRLAAIARMSMERSFEESTSTAKALVGIDVKLRKLRLKQDTNWDDRIGELYAALCDVDPVLPTVLTEQPGFGQPGHALFLSKVPQDTVNKAIDGFVATIATDPEYTWTNEVVFAIGESTRPEHLQLLRSQLPNLSVRDAVLMELADAPQKEDRALFLTGLESAQLNAVEACLKALTKLPRSNDAAEQFSLLSAARRLMNDDREFGLREMAMRLLQNNTGQSLQFVFGQEGHKPQPEAMQAWQDWLTQRYPDFRPVNADDAARTILASLDDVPWDQGDLERGRKLFERLSCAKCHGGRRALGPDLTGVARRFSRDDLFAAIVDPNRDISPRYQTTSIATTSGKIFTGLIVYESIDGLLLRDAEHKTYRIEGDEIDSKHLQRNSLMPNGLLRDISKADIADLNIYLQSL